MYTYFHIALSVACTETCLPSFYHAVNNQQQQEQQAEH